MYNINRFEVQCVWEGCGGGCQTVKNSWWLITGDAGGLVL